MAKSLRDIITKIPDRKLTGAEEKLLDLHKIEVVDNKEGIDDNFSSPETDITKMAISGKSKEEMNSYIKSNSGNWQKANEETITDEEINELSKPTLGAYIKKAHSDKSKDRTSGVEKAVDKLTDTQKKKTFNYKVDPNRPKRKIIGRAALRVQEEVEK